MFLGVIYHKKSEKSEKPVNRFFGNYRYFRRTSKLMSFSESAVSKTPKITKKLIIKLVLQEFCKYKLLRYADFFRFSLTSFEYPEKNIFLVKDHSLRSSINYLQLVNVTFAKFSFVKNLQTKVLIFPAKNRQKTGVSTFAWPVVAS